MAVPKFIEEEPTLLPSNSSSSSDVCDNNNNEYMETLLNVLKYGQACRYLSPRTTIPRVEGPLQLYMLDEFLEDRFQSHFRMNKYPFMQIANLIQDNEVFQNESYHQQAPAATQLAVALFKMGCSDQSTVRSLTLLGVGDGTVHLYLWRVIRALMVSHYADFVKWPTEAHEMKKVQDKIEEGTGGNFPGCCGFVNGSYIKPAIDGNLYWSQKKSYCFNVQSICNWNLQFTYVMLGPVRSVHDSKAFKAMDLYRNPQNYFPQTGSGPLYIIGDKGYFNTNHLIVPYCELAASQPLNQKYNIALSQGCIKIEHAFGVLKNWFGSLTCLPVRIWKDDNHIKALLWIGSCICLHNIILMSHGRTDPILNDSTLIPSIEGSRSVGLESDAPQPEDFSSAANV